MCGALLTGRERNAGTLASAGRASDRNHLKIEEINENTKIKAIDYTRTQAKSI